MYELIERDSFEQAVRDCADVIIERLGAGLAQQERVTFMASGGNVPTHVLPLVAEALLDWERITVFASDERIVPVDHADSNEGAIRRALAGAGPRLHYHGLSHTGADAALVERYDAGLAALVWPPAVGLIGIGADAHTASLFPDRPEVLDEGARVLLVPETPPHRHARLTLGVAALGATPLLTLIVNGAEKRNALTRALSAEADPVKTPITRLLKSPATMLRVYLC